MYLTKRQRQMLDCIQRFIEENGYSPTLEEIGSMMGLSSPATVHKHLQNLEAKEQIRRRHNHSRALELVGAETNGKSHRSTVPMLGYVAAGTPIEAIENPEAVEVPQEFLGTRESFVLRVKGDSMIEDGIHNGDWIIVEKRDVAENGQTVVALVENEAATVKRYVPDGFGKVRLEPANSAMRAITYPASSVRIQGVLIGLMRKYNQ